MLLFIDSRSVREADWNLPSLSRVPEKSSVYTKLDLVLSPTFYTRLTRYKFRDCKSWSNRRKLSRSRIGWCMYREFALMYPENSLNFSVESKNSIYKWYLASLTRISLLKVPASTNLYISNCCNAATSIPGTSIWSSKYRITVGRCLFWNIGFGGAIFSILHSNC